MDYLNSVIALKSLDCLSTRLEALATNIANANSPGYRPTRVSFEAELKAAAFVGPKAVEAVRPNAARETNGAADGVRLDLEISDAAAAGRRYTGILELLSRQIQIEHLVANGGR